MGGACSTGRMRVPGATTSQFARVLTSGVLVAQVTGTGRTFRVLSNELRLSRFLDL
jgi:hypothetical protein